MDVPPGSRGVPALIMGEKRDRAVAGLRVLRHLVFFDERVDPSERAALRGFGGIELDDVELDAIFSEPIAFTDAIEGLTHAGTRKQVLRTARSIAHGRRSTHEDEAAIAKVRNAWGMRKKTKPAAAYKDRQTDLSELSRRFTHGEAGLGEMVRKIRDNLGED